MNKGLEQPLGTNLLVGAQYDELKYKIANSMTVSQYDIYKLNIKKNDVLIINAFFFQIQPKLVYFASDISKDNIVSRILDDAQAQVNQFDGSFVCKKTYDEELLKDESHVAAQLTIDCIRFFHSTRRFDVLILFISCNMHMYKVLCDMMRHQQNVNVLIYADCTFYDEAKSICSRFIPFSTNEVTTGSEDEDLNENSRYEEVCSGSFCSKNVIELVRSVYNGMQKNASNKVNISSLKNEMKQKYPEFNYTSVYNGTFTNFIRSLTDLDPCIHYDKSNTNNFVSFKNFAK